MAAKDQAELLRQAELLCNQAKVLAEQAQKVIRDIQEPKVDAVCNLRWVCPECGWKHTEACAGRIKPDSVECDQCEREFKVNK